MKKLISFMCLVLALTLALLSLKDSAALSQNQMFRSIGALVALDSNATLKLEGFDNQTLLISNVNKKYFHVGYITNNSKKVMNLQVTMTPDFSRITNKGYWMGINIGGTITEFVFGSPATSRINLTLSPGQILDVQAALTANQGREVIVSYSFLATAADNTFTMTLNDTTKYPRRMQLK